MNERGSFGALKRIRSSRPTATAPTASVAALVRSRSFTTPTSTSQYEPSVFGYPEDLGQLIDDQTEPDREDEAFEDRLGEEVRDPAHAEHAEEDVHDADAQRERDDRRQVVG